MAGLISTFGTATSGIDAQRKALDVTSHNIANANTAGYSRETAVMESNAPYTIAAFEWSNWCTGWYWGNGNSSSKDKRQFHRLSNKESNKYKWYCYSSSNYLNQIQNIINEPSSTGISSLMSTFYSAWQSLSSNPSSSNARTVVAQDTSTLTNSLNSTYTQLQTLKSDAQTDVCNQVFQMNSTLNQIDTINQQIMQSKIAGIEPNDLFTDKRDSLVDTLSSTINLNTSNQNLDGISVVPVDTTGVSNPNVIQTTNTDEEKKIFIY